MVEVKLAKYKGLKVKKNKTKVEKEEIKKSLDYLQNSRAKIITVNRPCKKGDRAEIDFEVRQGGVKIENGESRNHPLILGQGHFIPGFEEKLEGMKANQEKEFSLKNFDIKVKMNLVQERELPNINDEFAKSLGNFDSLNALEKSIEQGLLQEKEIKEKQRIRIELIEKVAKDSKIETPNILVENELERMINEFKASITSMGLKFETYLKQIYPHHQKFGVGAEKTIEELKKDWQKQAEKRVEIALCLQAIADQENIQINDEEIKEKINQDLKNYPNIEEVEKNIDLNQLKEYTKAILRNEKVFELLEQEAKII